MTSEMLRKIPLFATLNPEELEDLLKQLITEKYPPHTVIFWMDEPGDKLYLIEKGEVRISYTNKNGKEITLATQGEGTFFGELSLLDAGPHTATVRTINETTVLYIDQGTFYSYLDKHPQFSRTLLAVLVDRLRTNIVNMHLHTTEKPVVSYQPASFRRFVDKAASLVSSSRFLICAAIFVAGWIIFQTWYYQKLHNGVISFADNPPTFFFLGFMLTLTSFLLTILVLTSQRRLAEQDRIRAEIEYQVNLKAQAEIMRLQLKMDEVLKLLEEKDDH
ncbi:cyclic nucleotide-binding domain-containing protein [Panacibacter ginsenosidivorans]|uniref:Cyclic nucleotide-binding domain-containing protein n=1 Tax=Panacibacter ginsenosidivorans TaxID=1813871 RepID=A0A5B8VA12_9BACT|nr:cyclic nucleotide-binding domain-containing protein [Panacibacter ginsenosidivorans]QEC68327.1 cyclic nucleotide-binding domain-containing protein [Panacibacter ginsenosidivorans]